MSNVSNCAQVQSLFTCCQSQEIFENRGQQESVFQPTDVSLGQPKPVPDFLCFGINDYLEVEVPVPSSDHVAEIVGKRGCKIWFLMDATKAKIVTPRRDEQPIFKVSGDQFAVDAACKLIVEAAEQFSKIQEVRQFEAEMDPIGSALPSNTFLSDVVLMKLEVPYCLVGLVIGWKGQNVRAIKQETNVEIVSPECSSARHFHLLGSFENVLKAKSSIDSLILERTGKVDATHFVDDVSHTNTSNCVKSFVDDNVSQEGEPAVSTVGFNKNDSSVPFLNLSDFPSTSSATRTDVMCSRGDTKQDQPHSPPVEKKIIRSRFFPDITLEITVNRKENLPSSSPTGFRTKAQGMRNCNL